MIQPKPLLAGIEAKVDEEPIKDQTVPGHTLVATPAEAGPEWIIGKVNKSEKGSYDLNFPFRIVVKEIACNCNDLKFAQYKSGHFTLIGEGNRRVKWPACISGGWCSDTIKFTDPGPKSVELFKKIIPVTCSIAIKRKRKTTGKKEPEKTSKSADSVTYTFWDAPGYERNFDAMFTFGERKRKVIGIEWNVRMEHKLWCNEKELYSITFDLTGSKTKKKDGRKIKE